MEEDWLPQGPIENLEGLNRYFAEERRDLGKIIRAEIIQVGKLGARFVQKGSESISIYLIEIESEKKGSYTTHIPKKILNVLERKAR